MKQTAFPPKIITCVLLLLFLLTNTLTHQATAQCPITEPDVTIACGGSATLTGILPATKYNIALTPSAPITLTAPTFVLTSLCDDCVRTNRPIGFPFTFYGNTYTTVTIQDNGMLFFAPANTGTAALYTPKAMPFGTTANTLNNYIAGLHSDIDLSKGGTVAYETVGLAPNRRFVLSYDNVQTFGVSGTGTASFQIILNENNTFNILIKQLSANWFSSAASRERVMVGAENLDGVAQALPGMNNEDFGAIVATDLFCYTYTPVACTFVGWKQGATVISVPANNNIVTVSPTTNTVYTATWQCDASTCTDDILVTVGSALKLRTSTNDRDCNSPNGTVSFFTTYPGNSAGSPYTMSYLKNGVTTTSTVLVVNNLITNECVLTGLSAGTYTNFSLQSVGSCASNLNVIAGPVVILPPVPPAGVGANICVNASGNLTSNLPSGTLISQGSTFNSGELATTDPAWRKPIGVGASCTFSIDKSYFDVFPFSVTKSGAYIFDGCFVGGATLDGFGHLYQDIFDSSNPCNPLNNYVFGDDDGNLSCTKAPRIPATLVAGVKYYLISGTFSNVTTGNYSWTYTGPVGGNVITGAEQVVTWYTAPTGGTLLGTGASFNPVGVAGSGIANTASPISVTYYLDYTSVPGCRTPITFVVSAPSSSPTPVAPFPLACPNTSQTLTSSGGVAGLNSSPVAWYDAPNGTGNLLATGSTLLVSPLVTTTYYVYRGGCGSTSNAITVTVRPFVYSTAVSVSTTNFCVDNVGWKHFFNSSNEIIFSVNGNIGATPTATIKLNSGNFQSPNLPTNCGSLSPGNEKFEMARSWNLNLGGTVPSGAYAVRFYYPISERTAIETIANAWKTAPANASCGYASLYNSPLATATGFYWFKNLTGNYAPPKYDEPTLHYLAGDATTATGGAAGGNINYVELTGLTSFSGGSGAIILVPVTPLPVSLLSFTGKRMTKDQIKLFWETVAETNNAGFEVEMSNNARDFAKIGFVEGKNNTKTVANYDFLYNNTTGAYFRLKQLDNNGKFAYSKIIYIEGTAEGVIRIYPNPATDVLTIDLGQFKANENATVTFKSVLGVTVLEKVLNQVQTDISVATLAKGVYIIEINKNGKKIIEKVVVQ